MKHLVVTICDKYGCKDTFNCKIIIAWNGCLLMSLMPNYKSRHHIRKLSNNIRRVWRYQRGNQNPYIEEEQTTQWPKEKVQKDKQWSTKHAYKTKDRVTRTPLKTGGELRCSRSVSSSCSTSDTRRVNLVTNSVISHELGDNRSGNQEWTIQRYWQH